MVEEATILRWRTLHDRWWVHEQLARQAQGEMRLALENFVAGGLPPSMGQLHRLDALLGEAEIARDALDALVLDVMQ